MVLATIGVLFLLLVGLGWLKRKQETEIALDQPRGLEAFLAGRLVEAEYYFQRGVRQRGFAGAVARFNLASVCARRGDFDEALTILWRLEADVSDTPDTLKIQVWLETARISAILGDLTACDGLLARAASAKQDPEWIARSTVSIATVRCRQERFDHAIDVLNEGWSTCTQAFVPDQLGWLSALKAFALASRPDKSEMAAQTVLLQLPPINYDQLAHAARTWPKLAAFLTRYNVRP